MFAATGLDESVEGVIDIVIAGFNQLVGEEDDLLRVVLDVGDVAYGVVGVVEVLDIPARPGWIRLLGIISGEV